MARIELPATGGIRQDVELSNAQPGQWSALDDIDLVVAGRMRARAGFETAITGSSLVSATDLSDGDVRWVLDRQTQVVAAPPLLPDGSVLSGTLGAAVPLTPALTAQVLTPPVTSGYTDSLSTYVQAADAAVSEVIDTYFTAVAHCMGDASPNIRVHAYATRTGEPSVTWDVDLGEVSLRTPQVQWLSGTDIVHVCAYSSASGDILACELDTSTGAITTVRALVPTAGITYATARGYGSAVYIAYWTSATTLRISRWDDSTHDWVTFVSSVSVSAPTSTSVTLAVNSDGEVCLGTQTGADSYLQAWTSGGVSLGSATVNPGAATVTTTSVAPSGATNWLFACSDASAAYVGTFIPGGSATIAESWVGASVASAGTELFDRDGGVTPYGAIALRVGQGSSTEIRVVGNASDGYVRTVARGLFGQTEALPQSSQIPHLGTPGEGALAFCATGYTTATSAQQLVVSGTTCDAFARPAFGRIHATMGSVSMFSGAALTWYDGDLFGADTSLSDVPTITASVGAGGSVTVGVYGVAITREWYDADGNRWQSAPAVDTLTTTVGNQAIDVDIEVAAASQDCQRGSWVLWLTAASGTEYYRAATIPAAQTGFNIVSNVAGLTSQETLYTSSEPPRLTPGLVSVVGVAGSRFWAASGSRVYYSHEPSGGEAAQFAAGVLYLDLPERVTGIGAVDELPVILTTRGAYRVVGDGPDRTGGGGSYVVQRISGALGCTSAHTLTSRVGLWYQSARGIELLARGGAAPLDVGHQVRDLADGLDIYSVAEDPRDGRCIIGMGQSGTGVYSLVYHYDQGAWTRWTCDAGAWGVWGSRLTRGEGAYVSQQADDARGDWVSASVAVVPFTPVITSGATRPSGVGAPGQWSAVTHLVSSTVTATIATTLTTDSDAGPVTSSAQNTTAATTRARLRVVPQRGASDALQVSVALQTASSNGQIDWLGATLEYEQQPGTSRVPSGRSV